MLNLYCLQAANETNENKGIIWNNKTKLQWELREEICGLVPDATPTFLALAEEPGKGIKYS